MPRISIHCTIEPDAVPAAHPLGCGDPKPQGDQQPMTFASPDPVESAPQAIDPATILAFIEIAKQLVAWFRSRR
jgi:hypothetical protein